MKAERKKINHNDNSEFSANDNSSECIELNGNSCLTRTLGLENRSSAKKQFIYNFMTYLKDSNAQGNSYFAKYFEWQGVCREAWFYNCISEDFLAPLGFFITKLAHNDYKIETFPFSSVRCIVNTRNVKKASFDIVFKFCDPKNESIVFSEGYQTMVFADRNKKIIRIPEDKLEEIKSYSLN